MPTRDCRTRAVNVRPGFSPALFFPGRDSPKPREQDTPLATSRIARRGHHGRRKRPHHLFTPSINRVKPIWIFRRGKTRARRAALRDVNVFFFRWARLESIYASQRARSTLEFNYGAELPPSKTRLQWRHRLFFRLNRFFSCLHAERSISAGDTFSAC